MPKSNKQRRAELHIQRARKRQRAETWQVQLRQATTASDRQAIAQRAARAGVGVVWANHAALATHNNTYGGLPAFYIDQPFVCRTCGAHDIWTAQQQQWWFEQARGHMDSQAIECRACRTQRRAGYATTDAALALHHQAQHLRSLCTRSSAHNPEALADVLSALHSKWHGIRIVAIGVLGSWWGHTRNPRWLNMLRAYLLPTTPSTTTPAPDGTIYVESSSSSWVYQSTSAALKAIAIHTQMEDMDETLHWLIQHCQPCQCPYFVWHLPTESQKAMLQHLCQQPWWHVAHHDAAIAHYLPWLLSAAVQHHGHTQQWRQLAQHYLASPCIQPAPTWLQRQLDYIASTHPAEEQGKPGTAQRGKTRRPNQPKRPKHRRT